MVVAVIAARAVQVTADQIVGVIAMRNAFVAAAGAVLVTLVVRRAFMGRCAGRSVGSAYIHGVIIDMIAMHVVHVTVVKVAIVIAMFNCLVTTAVSVLMIVLAVYFTRHLTSPFPNCF